MVNDGITVLIGGLVREESQKTIKGIPLLSRIPILGIPFRSTSTQKKKSELAILLTPYIVNGELPEHGTGVKP
jgi:type II secretory pathway component GspD/PulD (secretin)